MNALFLFICCIGVTHTVLLSIFYAATWISSHDWSTKGPIQAEIRVARKKAASIRVFVSISAGLGALSVWSTYSTAWGALFFTIYLAAIGLTVLLTKLPDMVKDQEAMRAQEDAMYRFGWTHALEWVQQVLQQGEAQTKEGQDPYRSGEVVRETVRRKHQKIEKSVSYWKSTRMFSSVAAARKSL